MIELVEKKPVVKRCIACKNNGKQVLFPSPCEGCFADNGYVKYKSKLTGK